jgi:O-acetyl-ADP-ribose deacetylase (regulator of RNase III)
VRTLTADGRKEKVNGRDVQTTWDKQRLMSETSVGDAKVTETYERSTTAPHLIVTTRMEMRDHDVSVRRVYDALTK